MRLTQKQREKLIEAAGSGPNRNLHKIAYEADWGNSVTLEAGAVIEALRRVKGARATDDVREYLEGVTIDTWGRKLYLVASNGHQIRLNGLGNGVDNAPENWKQIILERDCVAQFSKALRAVPKRCPVKMEALNSCDDARFMRVTFITEDSSVAMVWKSYQFGSGGFGWSRCTPPIDHFDHSITFDPGVISALGKHAIEQYGRDPKEGRTCLIHLNRGKWGLEIVRSWGDDGLKKSRERFQLQVRDESVDAGHTVMTIGFGEHMLFGMLDDAARVGSVATIRFKDSGSVMRMDCAVPELVMFAMPMRI